MRHENGVNGVNIQCALAGEAGAALITAQAGGLYGIGVGNGEDGRALFLTREDAAELLESLLEFIEGGE